MIRVVKVLPNSCRLTYLLLTDMMSGDKVCEVCTVCEKIPMLVANANAARWLAENPDVLSPQKCLFFMQ